LTVSISPPWLARWLVLALAALLTGCQFISPPTPTPAQPASSTATGAPSPTGATAPPPAPAAPGQSPSPAASPPPASPSPSPSPVARVAVRVVTGQTLGGWVLDVADRQGFLASQNLALDKVVEDPGETKAAADVAGRARDVGVVATDRFMREARDGQALLMVGGLVNKVTMSLIAARDVPNVADLKGKLIAYRDPEDATTAVLKRVLRAKNIADPDVRLMPFPDPGVVGAAVANGTVGASWVGPAQSARLRTAGFQWIGEGTDIIKDFQAEGIVVRPDWARQNEDTLLRLLRSVLLAERWIATPGNRDAAVALLASTLRVTSQDASLLFEQYVEKAQAIPREGDIDQAGIRGVADLLAEINVLKPPLPDPVRLADTTYLQRAKSSLPR
jgi:ABC-type nitrate/sulfonate/bicarbonate transport system substrate-binding protein